MNVVIIEDEELAAARLERMIQSIDNKINVLSRLESVEDSVEWFRKNPQPDLIFLDIHLEDGLSFSIFENVDIKSPIIFTTAFDEYAIKAFKLKSIDYLLKPIVQEELSAAIRKYQDWSDGAKTNLDLNSLYDLINKAGAAGKEPDYKTRFAVQVGQKIKTINTEEVAYFYSEDSMTYLVCNNKLSYTIDSSLDQLCEQLNPRDFFSYKQGFPGESCCYSKCACVS